MGKRFDKIKETVKRNKWKIIGTGIVLAAGGGIVTAAVFKMRGNELTNDYNEHLSNAFSDVINGGAGLGIGTFGDYLKENVPDAVKAIDAYRESKGLDGNELADEVYDYYKAWAADHVNVNVTNGRFRVDVKLDDGTELCKF